MRKTHIWNIRLSVRFVCTIATVLLCQSFTLAQSTSKLVEQAKSGDESARVKAIQELGKSEATEESMTALGELYLGDNSTAVRRAARIALGKLRRKATQSSAVGASKPFAFSSPNAKPGEKISAGLASTGSFGFGINSFSPEDYVEPTPPTERVAELIQQLKKDPQSSATASKQLSTLGDEALPAAEALIEVMMKGQPNWRESRLAATECLEKIAPELQPPVWKIILEEPQGISTSIVTDIANLGPKGRPALPLLFALWNAPEEKGYRVEAHVLATMHVVALKEPVVTNEIVKVIKGQTSVGGNCFNYAIEICDQRGLPSEQILELLTPLVLTDVPGFANYAAQKLMDMVEAETMKAEPVASLFVRRIEKDIRVVQTVTYLGQLGSAAKEALPVLKALKYEHQDEAVRNAATQAMNLIDM